MVQSRIGLGLSKVATPVGDDGLHLNIFTCMDVVSYVYGHTYCGMCMYEWMEIWIHRWMDV
jgi:hypothetical protein